MATKHTSENAARAAARRLGTARVQIIHGRDQNDQWVYFVDLEENVGIVRNWERVVYAGQGRNARARPAPKPTPAQVLELEKRILGKFFFGL